MAKPVICRSALGFFFFLSLLFLITFLKDTTLCRSWREAIDKRIATVECHIWNRNLFLERKNGTAGSLNRHLPPSLMTMFNPWSPRGGKRELTPASCPLTSCTPWHIHTINKCKKFKYYICYFYCLWDKMLKENNLKGRIFVLVHDLRGYLSVMAQKICLSSWWQKLVPKEW